MDNSVSPNPGAVDGDAAAAVTDTVTTAAAVSMADAAAVTTADAAAAPTIADPKSASVAWPDVASALYRASHPVDHPEFDQFVATTAALRAPDGCPWDREQTHESIAHNMIEEAYEAVDAIEARDVAHLREELGDVLLQVVLHSQIAADAGEFDIDDVCADVNAKMVRRHPHVFGETSAESASEVLDLWDKVKLAERNATGAAEAAGGAGDTCDANGADGAGAADGSGGEAAPPRRAGLLDGVPTSFPALMQAQKVSRKAAAAGFEWDTLDEVWEKVREEIGELQEAYAAAPKAANGNVDASAALASASGARATAEVGERDGSASAPTDSGLVDDSGSGSAASVALTSAPAFGPVAASGSAAAAVAAVELEFGDVLFSLVNVARRMGVDAESALRATCAKFRSRWAAMEATAAAQGRRIEDLSADEQESLWEAAKQSCQDASAR